MVSSNDGDDSSVRSWFDTSIAFLISECEIASAWRMPRSTSSAMPLRSDRRESNPSSSSTLLVSLVFPCFKVPITVERLSSDNEARDCVTSSMWRLSNSRMLLSIAGTDWLPCVPSSSALIGASDALWFSDEAMCYTGKMIVYYIVMTIHIVWPWPILNTQTLQFTLYASAVYHCTLRSFSLYAAYLVDRYVIVSRP